MIYIFSIQAMYQIVICNLFSVCVFILFIVKTGPGPWLLLVQSILGDHASSFCGSRKHQVTRPAGSVDLATRSSAQWPQRSVQGPSFGCSMPRVPWEMGLQWYL